MGKQECSEAEEAGLHEVGLHSDAQAERHCRMCCPFHSMACPAASPAAAAAPTSARSRLILSGRGRGLSRPSPSRCPSCSPSTNVLSVSGRRLPEGSKSLGSAAALLLGLVELL
jgi:hypothetical protein